MHRLLLRCFLCSSSSTTPTAGAGFIRELATLVAACHFHTSVGLAKSLLLYSQPPATSVPDLYHTLVSTAAASQVDPHPPSFLSNAASALIVASALLALPDGALWLLSLLADAHANLPSLSSYNLLREFLLSLDRHADVGRAFDLLNAPGARPDTFTWNKAIQVSQRPGAHAFSYNVVIAGLWRAGRGSDVVDVFDEMAKRVVLPSHITYNTMIDGHIKIGDLEACFRPRDQMLHHGMKSNMITYNMLLSGPCHAGRIGEMTVVLYEMMSWKMVLDGFIYSIRFDGHSRVGDSLESLKGPFSTFQNMKSRLVSPNHITYNALINGLGKAERITEAHALVKEREKNGASPSVETFNMLIDGYGRDGQLEKNFILLSDMREKGVKPNVVSYGFIVNAFCKNGKIPEAVAILDDMFHKDVLPSAQVYNAIIDAYIDCDATEQAFTLAEKMKTSGVQLHAIC
uniref:Pentatricopeptide repeat-containing protein n=1 Tax=Aegilops tauschii TaxID=37682 RepID=M8CLU2_AEGTA